MSPDKYSNPDVDQGELSHPATCPGARQERGVRRVLGILFLAVVGVLIFGSALWGAGMLYFAGPGGPTLRSVLVAIVALAALLAIVALCLRRWRWRALLIYAVLLALLGSWWNSIRPSNDRDRQPEVAKLPEATIQGNLVTVRNIRNFDYRTETEFTPQPRRLRVLRQLSDRQCQSRHRRCGGHPCALPARIARRSPDARADRPAGPAPGEPGR